MASPKSRISRRVRGNRRSHTKAIPPATTTCEVTGELTRPHRAHKSSDGALYYKGKPITAAKE